jgi:hypothetical protein
LGFETEELRMWNLRWNVKSDEKSDVILEMEDRFRTTGIGSSEII